MAQKLSPKDIIIYKIGSGKLKPNQVGSSNIL